MKERTKLILGACLLTLFAGLPHQSMACSLVGCLDRGIEVDHDLTAVVKLERKPLAGVTVEIRQSNKELPYVTGVTDATGKAVIRKLAAGDYWISVRYLGISAGYHCFHVLPDSSPQAKSRLNYKWGDYAIPMRSVRGTLRRMQPGTGGTPIWNLTHQTAGPIIGAEAQLRNATTQQVLSSTSDTAGDFGFDAIAEGTYVLHFDGNSGERGYDPTDLLIRVSHTATRDTLTMMRQETGCGGVTLRPELN